MKIIIGIISALVIGGGYLGYQEFAKVDTVEKGKDVEVEATASAEVEGKEVENEEPKLEFDQVKEIVQSNLDSMFDVFNKKGKEYHWNNANPADYELLKPSLTPYATEEFSDTELKNLSADYYCECDFPFVPQINYDVHFTFTQIGNDKLTVEAIDPATDLNNSTNIVNFTFVMEDGNWKMNKWEENTIDEEKENLNLTMEEAQLLLQNDLGTYEFIEEYTSKNTGNKAYLFDSEGFKVGISATDGVRLSDYELKTTTENTDAGTTTLDEAIEYDYVTTYIALDTKKESLIETYGAPISEIQTNGSVTLEYADAIYTFNAYSGDISKIEIIGEKAASYFASFDEVKNYMDPNPVSERYYAEQINDENGHHLVMDDGYASIHTFTADDEAGNSINKITYKAY